MFRCSVLLNQNSGGGFSTAFIISSIWTILEEKIKNEILIQTYEELQRKGSSLGELILNNGDNWSQVESILKSIDGMPTKTFQDLKIIFENACKELKKSKLPLHEIKNYFDILYKNMNEKAENICRLEKEKKDVLEFVGLEFVRRDWTEAARKFQYDLHWKIFHNENPSLFIKKFVDDLKKGKFDELLIYKKGIRKSVESYTKTTPPHIKAARKAGIKKVGIIEYVMTLDGPEAVGFQKSKMDYEHYVEKQIKPLAEAVLVFFDLTFDDVLKASKQVSLGDF